MTLFSLSFCKLAFVIELFRHGARGPLTTLWNGNQQAYQFGQLLPSGMRQHYIFGQ